jgi:hypothetical protein
MEGPDSNFNVSSIPTIDRKTGAVTFTVLVADPGTLTWLLSFQNGTFGAFPASAQKCNAGHIRTKERCRAATAVFGRGAKAVATAGAVSFTARPTAAAKTAVANAGKQDTGLPVTALLTFQSSLGGAAVSHVRLITIKLRKASGKTARRSSSRSADSTRPRPAKTSS